MSKTKLYLGAAMALALSAGTAQAGTLYYSVMNNANEPPSATLRPSPATGQGWLILNDAETSATVTVIHNEATVNAANPITVGHIHRGPAGVAGPVIFPFPTPPTSPVGPLTWAIPTADVVNLKAGGLYTQIHNSANPGGDIRGQLIRVRFANAATNAAQAAVANALDTSAGLNTDLDSLLMQRAAATAAEQASAFDDFSARTVFAQTRQGLETMQGFEDNIFAQAALDHPGANAFSAFVGGGHSFGKRDTSAYQAGSKISRPSAIVGLNYGFADAITAGVAVGYADGEDKFTGNVGTTGVKTTAAMAYFSSASDVLVATVMFGYGWSSIDTSRSLASIGRTATSSHDGNAWTLGAKISAPFAFGAGTTIAPYGLLDYQRASVDAYTETGANAANLVVPKRKATDTAAELGAALQAPLGDMFRANLEAGWRQSLRHGGDNFSATLAGSPVAFNTAVIGTAPSSAHLGAGIAADFGGNLSASLGYNGLISSRMSLHAVQARLTLKI